jgi:hypothetical protein
MDGFAFDALTRSLTSAGSRRRALTGLVSGTLGLILAASVIDEAAAKKKCPPCKKRKKGKCKKKQPDGTACAGGTCRGGSCVLAAPGPVGPVTTADAACSGTYTWFNVELRHAQTFRALRSGQLTSASVVLHSNDEGADFDMEIWSVNEANAPSAVLAGTTIANVPATIAPGPRTLTGTFPAPTTVVAGLRYALVITAQPDETVDLLGRFNNPCPDGNYFTADTTDEAFTASPTNDLGFATFVTA